MTKEKLEQLISLRAEIREIEDKIDRLQHKKIEAARDVVNASGREYPYINGHATITGFDEEANERRMAAVGRKIELLEESHVRYETLELEVMEWIEGIDDSRIRRAVRLHYVEGNNWNKVAKLMHYERTTPQKMVSRYLDSQQQI